MTTLDFMLMAAVFIGLVTTWQRSPRVLNILPFGITGLAVVQISLDGYNANILPVYLAIVFLDVVAGSRLVRSKHSVNHPLCGAKLYLGVFGTALGILALILDVRATLYQNLLPADLSQMTWSDAFEAAHRKVSHQYAFGAWKQIDWEALYAEYTSQIEAAESKHDRQAYYRALLGFTSSIPDGHVWPEGDDFGAREAAIGAGYGLEVLGLEDGRVIAVVVSPAGPAEGAGMQWGAEILTWNGLPIQEVLDRMPTLWPLRRGAPATVEGRQLEQLWLLVRAPEGTSTSMSFRNPEDTHIYQVTLTAVYDGAMAQAPQRWLSKSLQPARSSCNRASCIPSFRK